tara:strand:+ start:179 stop:442 length:264 start_codon:yes stop_codon:yes gene_type:complete
LLTAKVCPRRANHGKKLPRLVDSPGSKTTNGGETLKQEKIPALTLPRSFIFKRINEWGLTPKYGAQTGRLQWRSRLTVCVPARLRAT